jgi:hypothetical protein
MLLYIKSVNPSMDYEEGGYISEEPVYANGSWEAENMKQEEKKTIPWEVADPKPPVIQSGPLANRRK